MPRLLRITTVPISLHLLLQGQFRYMRDHGFEVITMSADGKEVENVVHDGIKHIAVPFSRQITPLHDLICLWKLIKEIKRLRPDIVHTHTPKAGLLGMLASWICRVPVRLHTVAGLPLVETRGFKRYLLEVTEKITCACAQTVYPNSAGLNKFIQHELRISSQKLKLIGKGSSNGIDTIFFDRSSELERKARQLRVDYDVLEHDIVFSFVGRIVRDKGIVELVSAFREVVRRTGQSENTTSKKRKLFLMLVGDFEQDLNPLPTEIVKFITEDKSVILAGFQEDVRPWIVASDVFVFPSYREGFPNVVMQASLLVVPCIVSDINGCNEIIQHEATGTVIPPKDMAALAEAMQMMMEDEEKRRRFAAAARDFVRANFKREVVWEELRKEYERRLEGDV